MLDPTLLMSITARTELEERDRRAQKSKTHNLPREDAPSRSMNNVTIGLISSVAITFLLVLLVATP
ncbi:MAG: hypothetical protein ACK2UM_05145 [Anaerolineales bacterium]|jgi:hypothetical protein